MVPLEFYGLNRIADEVLIQDQVGARTIEGLVKSPEILEKLMLSEARL